MSMEISKETPAEAPAVRKMLSGLEGYPSRSAYGLARLEICCGARNTYPR